jgi:catalase
MRQTINRGQTSYDPNNLRGGCPFQAGMDMSGFTSYAERIDAQKIRERNPTFFDHFSQAAMFFNSQSEAEQNHIVKALRFELGKVETLPIRERMLFLLAQVDKTLATKVADGLGMSIPKKLDQPLNMHIPADGDPKKFQPKRTKIEMDPSPALSMANNLMDAVKTRKVAFLVGDGFVDTSLLEMKQALMTAGAKVVTVAPHLGMLMGRDGETVKADFSLLTASSVLFDAVYVPDGPESIDSLMQENESTNFVLEAYRHCKTIGAAGAGVKLLRAAGLPLPAMTDGSNGEDAEPGVVVGNGDIATLAAGFIEAMRLHRHWGRESTETQTGEQPLMYDRHMSEEARLNT